MGKNPKKEKSGKGFNLLGSSLLCDDDLAGYLEDVGGYSQPSDWEYEYEEASKECSYKEVLPDSGKAGDGPRTLKTEQSRSKRVGTEALAHAVLDAVPVKNIGGQLWVRMEPPLYRPMDVADVATILRSAGMLPKEDARLMHTCKDVFGCLASFPDIYLDELPIQKGRILFLNGWYDVTARRMIEPTEEDILIHAVNAELRPERQPTPVWDKFLETVSGGDASIQVKICEMLGYLLLPEQTGKSFFVLGTAPNSGKSVLAEFLQKLFGAKFTSAVSLHALDSEFALAPLLNKKLNVAMDLPADALSQKAVGSIKTVTGNDLISVNVKFEPHRQQRLTTKFLFGTNSPLILKSPDEAFWQRLEFIPFMKSVPKEEQNRNLLDELWEERTGIVQQGVLGARRLLANNYQFSACKRAENMVRKWAQTDDYYALDFVRDCCVTGDPNWSSGSSALHQAYCRYCLDRDLSPTSLTTFSRILNEHSGTLGIQKRHWNTGWGFGGIMLHPAIEFPGEFEAEALMHE